MEVYPDSRVLLEVKRNELSTYKKKERNLRCILSERGQFQKATYCMIPTV